MSDTGPMDEGIGTEESTAPVTTEPAAPESGGSGFDSLEKEYETLLETKGDSISLTRDQLQRYASEHKNYRQKWGEVARTFDGLHPDDVKNMGTFLRQVSAPESRTGALDWMRGVLDELSPKEKAAALDKIASAEDARGGDGDALAAKLDPDAVQKIVADAFSKRDEEARTRDFISRLNNRAKEIGEERGLPELGDTDSPLYRVLLSAAHDIPGDKIAALDKAADQLQTLLERSAQNLMSRKKTAGAAGPAVAQKGSEPGGNTQPKTMADARAALRARLDGQVGS